VDSSSFYFLLVKASTAVRIEINIKSTKGQKGSFAPPVIIPRRKIQKKILKTLIASEILLKIDI